MDLFWGTDAIYSGVSYMFNYKQLGIFMGILAFCIFFSMLYFKKSLKRQKIFLIITTVFLIIFEAIRIVWRYFYLKNAGGDLGVLNIIDLNLYTVALWLSIPMMLFVFIKKDHHTKFSQTLLTFVFSVTAVCALIDILYPVGIMADFPLYHVYNLQFLFSHALILLIALFLGASDWLKNKIDDIWKALLCLVVFVGVAVGIYYATSQAVDIAFIQHCPIFDDLGLVLPSPWHMVVLAAFFFCCQVFMYVPFAIFRYASLKRKQRRLK